MSVTTLSTVQAEGKFCTTISSIYTTITITTVGPSPTTSISSSIATTLTTTQVSQSSPANPAISTPAFAPELATSQSLKDTRFIILISVTGAIFLLVLTSLLIFVLYIRRRHGFRLGKKGDRNEETPPLTSLAPPPISFPPVTQTGADDSFFISPLTRVSTFGTPVPIVATPPPTRPQRSQSTPFLRPDDQITDFPSRRLEVEAAAVATSPRSPPARPIPPTPRASRMPRTPIIPQIDFQSNTPSSGESDVRELGYKPAAEGTPVSPPTTQPGPSGTARKSRFEEQSFSRADVKEDDAASMSIFRPGESAGGWFTSELPSRSSDNGGREREIGGDSSKGKEVDTVGSQSVYEEEEEEEGRMDTFDYFRFPVTGTRASSGVFPDPQSRRDVGG